MKISPLSKAFNNKRFSNLETYLRSDYLYIAGDYKGKLVSDKNPHLEILLALEENGYYSIDSVTYNGQKLTSKGRYNVIELLLTGRKSYGEEEIIYTKEEVKEALMFELPEHFKIKFHGMEDDNYVVEVYEE